MKGKRAGGRVLVKRYAPTVMAAAVSSLFAGARPLLEQRTLIKGGKPLARGYQRVKG